MSLEQFRNKSFRRGDTSLIILVLGLALFGLLIISSASVVVSYTQFGSNSLFLSKQAIALLIGSIGMIAGSIIDYRFWKSIAKPLLFFTLFLLIIVHIPGIGISIGGSRRWINLGPVLFQPSEMVKLTFAIYAATWLEKKGKDITLFREGVLPYLALLIIVGLFVFVQPDLGTTLVVTAIAVVMVFVAGISPAYFLGSGLAGLAVVYMLIRTSEYRWERFLTFLNPTADLQGAGYQINQALLAIGSGGWLGLGFGNSRQKYLYLPQVQTDAIFAIMVEELGFIRVLVVLLIILFIGLKGFSIAKKAPDNFSRYLACGISTWILFQAFVNVSGIMGILPLTGIPLPFISYGGSSLIILMSAVGILYNISRHTQENI